MIYLSVILIIVIAFLIFLLIIVISRLLRNFIECFSNIVLFKTVWYKVKNPLFSQRWRKAKGKN